MAQPKPGQDPRPAGRKPARELRPEFPPVEDHESVVDDTAAATRVIRPQQPLPTTSVPPPPGATRRPSTTLPPPPAGSARRPTTTLPPPPVNRRPSSSVPPPPPSRRSLAVPDPMATAETDHAGATELRPVDPTDLEVEPGTASAGMFGSAPPAARAPGWETSSGRTYADLRQRGAEGAPELKPAGLPPRPPGQVRPTPTPPPPPARKPHSPVDEAAKELARAALAAEIAKEDQAALRTFQAEDGEIPPSPEVARRFDVILQLGKGGMGVVYLCRDPRRGGKVIAVKDIRTELKPGMKVEQRVEHEAKLLQELDHPGIVKVYEFMKFPRGSAIVMEYIDGLPLDHEIGASRRVSWQFGVRVLKEIGAALQYAHQRGVIHRDLKPDNILFSERHDTMKLVDFGLARIYDDTADVHLTRTGMVVGTPHYMSPEQVSGRPLDQRSDVYSFGATLYYLLTGKRHVTGDNVMEILEQQRSRDLTPPSHLNRDIPAWVSYIIGKMMEIRHEDRYSSMQEMLDEVRRAEEDPEGFLADPTRGEVRRYAGRPLVFPTEPAPGTALAPEVRDGTAALPTRTVRRIRTRGHRTSAAAEGVLALLEEDEIVDDPRIEEMSGLLREISGRLEAAEKQRLRPGMLALIVCLSVAAVVLGVVFLILLFARAGWLAS